MRRKKSSTAKPATKSKSKETVFPRPIQPEELTPDGTVLCSFEIPGRPATKKTHQSIIMIRGAPRIIPSAAYTKYEKHCAEHCFAIWRDKGYEPMNFGIAIKMRVFLDTWQVGDHVGYMQSIGDILEKHGVLANDMFIHWESTPDQHWFGGKDPENPRVELEISRMRHPYEEYRQQQENAELKRLAKKLPPDSGE